MVNPLIPYAFQGVLWYQGEANVWRAKEYKKSFPLLIQDWRTHWGQGDFPFYFVQIAPHKGQNPDIREAQFLVSKSIPNTGMAVTTDVGNETNIHPIDKQTVGYRLALLARSKTYNEKNLVCSGPVYNHMKIKKRKIQLFFDEAENGFKKADDLKEFEIAGEDQVFYCNQRGIPTEKAIALIVNGFSKDVLNKLPMEFAVEAQKLLEISLEGSVG